MGKLKWIGGLLGWASGGPIGALIGFLFGSVIESGLESAKLISSGSGNATRRGYSATEQRNSFMMSLLVLSSAVIRADGKCLPSEMNYVRAFIRRNFGIQAENEAMEILNELNHKNIDIRSVGGQISRNMNYSQRLQLLHYLADLANADGDVCENERNVIHTIASSIGIMASDVESILAMFSKSSSFAYTVLEIDSSATNDEVKAAYRRLAMKNHPDKVASLGPEIQKAAEERFRRIQEAYETIKKERGFN